jgi:hypothetical protein
MGIILNESDYHASQNSHCLVEHSSSSLPLSPISLNQSINLKSGLHDSKLLKFFLELAANVKD